jgi:hypothetical protein
MGCPWLPAPGGPVGERRLSPPTADANKPLWCFSKHFYKSTIEVYKTLYVCLIVCLCICSLVGLRVCLYVCLFVCLFVCLVVCLFVCLLVCLFVCLFVCFVFVLSLYKHVYRNEPTIVVYLDHGDVIA